MKVRVVVGAVVGCTGVVLLGITPAAAQQGAPCSQCGPGSHWIDTCSAGQDVISDQGALVGIDLDLDCLADPGLSLILSSCGNLTVDRSDPLDDSANFSGLRSVDAHLDVIDTEIVSMCLTGGGVTLVAGQGQGQGGVLAESLGAIAEQAADSEQADSFFDVFFEIDLGGGNYAYNHTAMRIQININCVPPQVEYIHVTGCIPLFDDPTPGQGTKVANLVSAEHHVNPNQTAACCTVNGDCQTLTQSDCEQRNGTLHPGADCVNTGACCLEEGLYCLEATEECCKDLGGQYKGDGTACLGDENHNEVDDACEGCGAGLCGTGSAGTLLPMMLALGGLKLRRSRSRRRGRSAR